ncbi:MAG TPA: hypothetical protein VEJ84_11200 [Acidimicrobiales bacterium]|nr:hypothetical protein [Acidimicrobiales bacterium]
MRRSGGRVPGGYDELARFVPLLVVRQWVLEAPAAPVLADGFPLLPTGDHPHWTVLVSAPEAAQFLRVRRHFSEPKRNPVWGQRT